VSASRTHVRPVGLDHWWVETRHPIMILTHPFSVAFKVSRMLKKIWRAAQNQFVQNKVNQKQFIRNRRVSSKGLEFQKLEPRQLLAAIVLNSNTGVLTVAGGAGNDTGDLVFQSPSQVRASINGVADQFFDIADVNRLVFIGFGGNDTFSNQTFIASQLLGGDGDDTLTGGSADDLINGGTGNDVLRGREGEDRIYGFAGNDELHGDTENDRIFGGSGLNVINGGDGDDVLFGGDSIDRIFGEDGIDQIFGLGGNDFLSAGDGGVAGTSGSSQGDLILGHGGDDQFQGGRGLNIFYGGAGNDTIFGGAGENRLHGQAGDDNLNGGAADDYIAGHAGVDTIFARGGNDFIVPGTGNDVVNAGIGTDFVVYNGDLAQYTITGSAPRLEVHEVRLGFDGRDSVDHAERLRFDDGDVAANGSGSARTSRGGGRERITIQPIIVSNSNGRNEAEFFGSNVNEERIKAEINEIFSVAGVEVEWLEENHWDNSFANVGNGGTRPRSDLNRIVRDGDAAGVGSADPLVLDMYFVEIVPGFGDTNEFTANGLAFVGNNGIAIQTGDQLTRFRDGQDVVARVAAHEIAHNLGLSHVEDHDNLLDEGRELTQSQIEMILASRFTVPV